MKKVSVNYNYLTSSIDKKNDNIGNISNKKLPIIWALFDDSQSSYKKAIKKYFDKNYIVYSIGINDLQFSKNEFYFYQKIDISLLNSNLINDFKKLPKPDIILASPPCESWSTADCNGRMFRRIEKDGTWYVKNKKFYDNYNENCHPVKTRRFIQKEKGRILGESTIGATILLINEFNPKFWVIENPQKSKMWDFQENHWDFNHKKTTVYYSTYNNEYSAKPTTLKSNIKLTLNTKKTTGDNKHMSHGSYAQRSSIPLELIKDIIDEANNVLFKGLR